MAETITLTVLLEDMDKLNYTDSENCPITKALARAGRPDLRDSGTRIIDKEFGTVISGEDYDGFARRVIGMMKHLGMETSGNYDTIHPETFTHTLAFDEQ